MKRCDIKVRVPTDVKERLAEQAAANHRSFNGELLSMIEEALDENRSSGRGPNKVSAHRAVSKT